MIVDDDDDEEEEDENENNDEDGYEIHYCGDDQNGDDHVIITFQLIIKFIYILFI